MHSSNSGNELPGAQSACPVCGRPSHAVASGRALLVRPPLVTLLALLNYVAGGVNLLLGAIWTVSGAAREPMFAALVAVVAVVGLLHLACGRALWRLKRLGRLLQLALAWIGLAVFPLGTVIAVLLLVYFYKPEIKLLFSEREPETLTPSELDLLARSSNSLTATAAIAAGVIALGCGLIGAVFVPDMLDLMDRSRQRRTMARMREIASALEQFAADHGSYPIVESVDQLRQVVEPYYIRSLPRRDSWHTTIEVRTLENGYLIRSAGKDRKFEIDPVGGPTERFAADIIFSDGRFVQWPEGRQF